jgi:hypothetical protein
MSYQQEGAPVAVDPPLEVDMQHDSRKASNDINMMTAGDILLTIDGLGSYLSVMNSNSSIGKTSGGASLTSCHSYDLHISSLSFMHMHMSLAREHSAHGKCGSSQQWHLPYDITAGLLIQFG